MRIENIRLFLQRSFIFASDRGSIKPRVYLVAQPTHARLRPLIILPSIYICSWNETSYRNVQPRIHHTLWGNGNLKCDQESSERIQTLREWASRLSKGLMRSREKSRDHRIVAARQVPRGNGVAPAMISQYTVQFVRWGAFWGWFCKVTKVIKTTTSVL